MADDAPDKSSDKSNGATAEADTPKQDERSTAAPIPMIVAGQYVKDLSFENPGAPASFLQSDGTSSPSVAVSVDVSVQNVKDRTFEVVLHLRAEADRDDKKLFLAEIQYGGIFTLGDAKPEMQQLLLFVEAPRLLFPFARAIISNSVRDGGFPPLLVQPVDFAALHRQRLTRLHEQQQAQAAAASSPADSAVEGSADPVEGDA
jgi:preprotein translocase subunit SecB